MTHGKREGAPDQPTNQDTLRPHLEALMDRELERARPARVVGAGPAAAGDGAGEAAEGEVEHGLVVGDSVELSEHLEADLQGETSEKIVYAEGSFWRYAADTGTYLAISEADAARAVARYSRYPVGEGRRKRPLALSRRAIYDAVSVCGVHCAAPDFFRAAAPGVAFQNAFVALVDGRIEVRPHSPAHRARYALPFAYDAHAPCPRWQQFLTEVFTPVGGDDEPKVDDGAARSALLHEFAGACLLGLAPRYGKALVMIGTGANGKSVVLHVLSRLFPTGAISSIAPHRWKGFYLADLAGKLLNAVAEMPAREITESDLFKAVVTGDAIQADRKYRDSFRFTPVAGHLLSANTLPATRDQSQGYWRRLELLVFGREFAASEQDPTLADRLVVTELPGIAAAAIEGARRLLQHGTYTQPASSARTKSAWQVTSDQVREFLLECTVATDPQTRDPRERRDQVPQIAMVVRELYDVYRAWAANSGHHPVAIAEFGRRVRRPDSDASQGAFDLRRGPGAEPRLLGGRCTAARYFWCRLTPEGNRFSPLEWRRPGRGSPSGENNNV